MATEDIAGNGFGKVTVFGNVHDVTISNVTDDDHSLWTEGTILYLSTTAGKLSVIKPTAPKHGAVVGTIVS